MPKPLQNSFSAGELAPAMHGRIDIEGYRQGAKELTNFIPDAHGPATGRGGTRHATRIPGNDGRVVSLGVSEDVFVIALMSDLKFRLFSSIGSPIFSGVLDKPSFGLEDGGPYPWIVDTAPNSSVVFNNQDCRLIAADQGSELVLNGGFISGATGWTVREIDVLSTVSFGAGFVVLVPDQAGGPDERLAGIAQVITPLTAGEVHNMNISGDFSTGDLRVRVGLTEGSGEYADQILTQNGSVSFTPPDLTPVWITFDCIKPEISVRIDNISIYDSIEGHASISQEASALTPGLHRLSVIQNSSKALVGEVHVQVGTIAGNGDYLDVIIDDGAFDIEVNLPLVNATVTVTATSTKEISLDTVSLADASTLFEEDAPWPETELSKVHIVHMPSAQEVHFLHRNYPPYRLLYDQASGAFTWEAVPTAGFPTAWTEDNWPATGCYFWGRLWYAGMPETPQQVRGSATDDHLNFIVPPTDATGESPVSYSLQKFGPIRWIEGTKALLVGTSVGEYVVVSDSRFTDVTEIPDVQQQSAYGSNFVQPQLIGDQLLYISPDGRKLRSMQYVRDNDNWLSNDLTFFSEHITQSGVREMTWLQNPDNLIAMAREDGDVALMTYQKDQGVFGCSRVTGQGRILSIASPLVNGTHQYVALVVRSEGSLDLEFSMAHRSPNVDAGITHTSATPFTVVSGLDHLEGRVVQVLVDDPNNPDKNTDPLSVHPERVVVGGQITLQQAATEVVAGLKYVPRLETLDLNLLSQAGSLLNDLKYHNEIYVYVNGSQGFTIDGEQPHDRSDITPMNTREPNTTGIFEVTGQDFSKGGNIVIEQELPLPISVVYIGTDTTSGDI